MVVADPDEALIEAIAEAMHDAYETAAIKEGWETNPASRKPWVDVPEANKATMRIAIRVAYAAMVEHLGLFERSMTDYQIGYFVGLGVALQFGGTLRQCQDMLRLHPDWFNPESRVLVKRSTWVQSTPRGEWVEVQS